MQFSEQMRKCVAYLGLPTVDKAGRPAMRPGGTAFFVSMPSTVEGNTFVYLVTAKHAAKAVQGREFLVRVNKKDSGSFYGVNGIDTLWRFHPSDDQVDVAVFGWAPPDTVDFLAVPTSMFLTDDIIRSRDISEGDDVFITGLFTPVAGAKANMPIVRTGNIAMMPDEPIPTKLGLIDAYLIEARSIGGLSGSPAFVRETPRGLMPHFYFLGLMHGHWDIPIEMRDDTEDAAGGQGKVNMGIAIVVPAKKILEVLNQPILIQAREQHDDELRAKVG